MAVALQARKWMDGIAKVRQAYVDAAAARTESWGIIDAAGDETFENRVKGVNVTAFDDRIAAGGSFNNVETRAHFADVLAYCNLDLAVASPYFDSALAAWGFRAPYHFAEAWYEAMGARLLPKNVFPKGTYAAGALAATGMHKFGRLTGTAGASTYASTDGAIDRARMIGAVIVAHSVEADAGDTNLKVDPVLQDGVSKIAAGVALVPSASLNGHVVVGEQAITGVTNSTKITVAATGQFVMGEWVLLYKTADGDTSLREVAKIKAATGVVTNTSLEFDSAMVADFTGGTVIPLYTNAGLKSGTLASGKHVDLYAKPDRIIVL